MKKAIFVAIVSALCLFCTVSASALEPEAVAGATAVAANEAFESTIIGSIKGRAGATAPNGGKGIVFEACYAAKENVKDLFNGAKTSFTKSSTAKQVDLVKMKDGKVINRFQLKDTPNSADNVLRQVESGKYQQAQLLGTTETAKAYNPKAAAKNLKPMKDTGISSKTTARIAEKSFGKLAPISDLAGFIGKAGAVGAVLDGGISLAESLINGDDAYAVFANTAAGAGSGFVTGSAAALAGEAVTVVVVAAGGSGLVTIIVPAAAAIGVGCLADYAMENLIDENALAEAVEAAANFAKESGAVVVDTICTTATNAYELIAD